MIPARAWTYRYYTQNNKIKAYNFDFFPVGTSGLRYPLSTLISLATPRCVLLSGMCMGQEKPSQSVEPLSHFLENMGKYIRDMLPSSTG